MNESYEDDPTIQDDEPLWRRIPPCHIVNDDNTGQRRPSSAAFCDHPNGTPMSVVLGEAVLAAGRTKESIIEGHEGFGLASFTAELARSLNQGIMRKPENDEPAHAEVFGKKTGAVRKQFAKGSAWIILPPVEPQAQA